jgi:hypothetical protein
VRPNQGRSGGLDELLGRKSRKVRVKGEKRAVRRWLEAGDTLMPVRHSAYPAADPETCSLYYYYCTPGIPRSYSRSYFKKDLMPEI